MPIPLAAQIKHITKGHPSCGSAQTGEKKSHTRRSSLRSALTRVGSKVTAFMGCMPSTQRGTPCQVQPSGESGEGTPHATSGRTTPLRPGEGEHSETRHTRSEPREAMGAHPTVSGPQPKCKKKKPRKLTFRHGKLWFHAENRDEHFREQDTQTRDLEAARLFKSPGTALPGTREVSTTKTFVGGGAEQGRDGTAHSGVEEVSCSKPLNTNQEEDRYESPEAPKNTELVNWPSLFESWKRIDVECNDSCTSGVNHDHPDDCNVFRGSSSTDRSTDRSFGVGAWERICIHNFYISRQGETEYFESLCRAYNTRPGAMGAVGGDDISSNDQSMKSEESSMESEKTASRTADTRSVAGFLEYSRLCSEEIFTDMPSTRDANPENELTGSPAEQSNTLHEMIGELVEELIEEVTHTTEFRHFESISSAGAILPELIRHDAGRNRSSSERTPTKDSIFEIHDTTATDDLPGANESKPEIILHTQKENESEAKVTTLTKLTSFPESQSNIFSETSITDSDPKTYSRSRSEPIVDFSNAEYPTDDEDAVSIQYEDILDEGVVENVDHDRAEGQNTVSSGLDGLMKLWGKTGFLTDNNVRN